MQEISCSIPIRVRNQNFYATLAINVEGEFSQFWNGNNAVPQWTPTNKGPKLTPNVVIPSGANCTNIDVVWYRSDKGNTQGTSDLVAIAEFNIPTGGTASGLVKTGFTGLIQAEHSTGSIQFIGNVATADNQDPDMFICEVEATVNGAKYKMRRSVTMNVSPMSTSGKVLSITASNGTALSGDSGKDKTKLTAKAYDGQEGTTIDLTDFIVEWEWEQEPETSGGNRVRTRTGNDLWVYRNKDTTGRGTNPWVNWEQLIVCRLWGKKNGAKDPNAFLALATINITDQADLIRLDYNVSGDIDATSPAVIKFWLEKRDNNSSAWAGFSPNGATWAAVVQDKIDNDTSQTWTGTFNSSGMAVHNETVNGSTQSVEQITITRGNMTDWGITTGDMKVTAHLPDNN